MNVILVKMFATALALSQVTTKPDAVKTEFDPVYDQAEVVELRFFSGMTVEEIARFLGVSKRTVEGDWTHAKAWLKVRLGEHSA